MGGVEVWGGVKELCQNCFTSLLTRNLFGCKFFTFRVKSFAA